jgi:hypothetical protein
MKEAISCINSEKEIKISLDVEQIIYLNNKDIAKEERQYSEKEISRNRAMEISL